MVKYIDACDWLIYLFADFLVLMGCKEAEGVEPNVMCIMGVKGVLMYSHIIYTHEGGAHYAEMHSSYWWNDTTSLTLSLILLSLSLAFSSSSLSLLLSPLPISLLLFPFILIQSNTNDYLYDHSNYV